MNQSVAARPEPQVTGRALSYICPTWFMRSLPSVTMISQADSVSLSYTTTRVAPLLSGAVASVPLSSSPATAFAPATTKVVTSAKYGYELLSGQQGDPVTGSGVSSTAAPFKVTEWVGGILP